MTKLQLTAQLFGLCGMFSLFVMYQQSKRIMYLKLKILSDVIWAAHYLMLFAVGGAIPSIVGIVRELILMKDFKRKYTKFTLMVIIIIINATLGILLADSMIHFIPICASALVTISLTFKKTTSIRLFSIPILVAFLIYDIIVGSWVGMLNEIISIVSIISKLLKSLW